MTKMSTLAIRLISLFCLLTLTILSASGNNPAALDSCSDDSISGFPFRLKLLSWNIGMLPVFDLFTEKDEKRAEAVATALFSCDYDIIVFEEAFSSFARSVIRHKLQDLYPYAYGPANRAAFSLKCNSGLWILSKFPLVIKKEIEFTNSTGFDDFARKGAILLEGNYHNTRFQLLATHLQDDRYPQYIREQQLKELYEKLIAPYAHTAIPQLICGDFNTDEKISQYYHGLLNILKAEDGAISGNMKITFDDEANDVYRSVHPDPRQIDYILTRNSQQIQWIRRTVAVLKSRWGNGKEYLSDHNGIEACIEFKNVDYLSKVYK